MKKSWLIAFCAVLSANAARAAEDNDPYIWLSDIHGERATAWVKEQDAKSNGELTKDALYAPLRAELLAALDRKDRIPAPRLSQGKVYNFWQDAEHHRGIWRRAAVEEYRKAAPAWDVLLDLDKYDAETKANWVFSRAECSPNGKRCLLALSPGGGDAIEYFEYDPAAKKFIEDGFHLKVAKSGAQYLDDDTILFETDFGPGSLTKSSYPRIVKSWHRGQSLDQAKTVFAGDVSDIRAGAQVFHRPEGATALINQGLTFFTSAHYLLNADGTTKRLALPESLRVEGFTHDQLVFMLRDEWKPEGADKPFPQGALVAMDVKSGKSTMLYAPGKHSAVESVTSGGDGIYASIFDDITGSIHHFRPGKDGKWSETLLPLPKGGSTANASADAFSGAAFFTFESFLTPPTLYETTGDDKATAVKSQAAQFDASKVTAEQFWATSADGEKIPYFLIRPKDAKGPLPTIQYGYGGFELSLFPWYWNDGHRPLDAAQAWVLRGGAVAVANIRGGGEFGPAWHNATRKLNHKRAFEDFAAVAQDLIVHGNTKPAQLGIVGASNGGLLVTATMVAHPDLFGAVVCQRPLVDMLRYTHFGAGASWVDEYGDPDKDPAIRDYIASYSAYQNVTPQMKTPPILFITETSDDRVTPIFARMMAAKMEDQGHDVLFNEAPEGGHGPGATNAEQADMWALSYTYFARKLGLKT